MIGSIASVIATIIKAEDGNRDLTRQEMFKCK